VKIKLHGHTINTRNILTATNMPRTTNKKTAAPSEKIVPLTGKALQAKIKELSNLPKSETAKGCGYYSVAKDGTIKVNLTKFYDAVLQSKGINVEKTTKADGRGREASYRATVQRNGQLLIGAVYIKSLNSVPGDEFEIKVGYKHINLKAIPKDA
jgi:AbrB-like transcriptional regulator